MKKLLSVVLAMFLTAALVAPVQTIESHAAFNIRTTAPSYTSAEGLAYYYSDANIFYQNDLGPNQKYLSSYKGYCIGNCTWYAYGRASEILGRAFNSNFRWSASQWWDINIAGNYYPYGSEPKVGAIACYSTHVAIVEKIENGNVYVSESGWQVSKNKPTSEADLRFHYGTPWQSSPKGYIYITDNVEASAKNVDYSVKITAENLNMRTGPGTEYSRIGYVAAGTYKVSQECGNWVKLADNGYWICLSYAVKVENAAETVVDTGTAANYQVKVTSTNLNMRTGPGTSYKTKGYIKPGTYTITKTSNGWGKVSETGYWIYLKYTAKASASSSSSSTSSALYKVKITASSLHMRTGPGKKYSSKGTLRKGKKYTIKDTKNGWGQLKKNGYWIKLSYTTPVSGEYNVKVTVKDLNMRKGPGTKYAKKGYVKPGVYTIAKTKGKWGKLKKNGYWIKLSYTKKL